MWAHVNASKKEISPLEKEKSEQRVKSFLNDLEQRAASFTDEQLAMLKRIMEKRGRAAAYTIVAPIGTAQLSNLRSRCSGISFDVRICTEELIEGKMEPELGELESSSAGMSLEAPGQQCLSNWEMERTTVDGCLLVDGSLPLGETTFFLKELVIGTQPDSQNSTSFASSKTVFLQMSSKLEDTKKLGQQKKQAV